MGNFVSAMDTLGRMNVRARNLFVQVPITRASDSSLWCLRCAQGAYFFDNDPDSFSMHFHFADPRDAAYVKTAFG